jgi:hypothetical protein
MSHSVTIKFRIIYQTTHDQQVLAVAGSESFCGNWDPQQAFKLSKVANNIWEGTIKLDEPAGKTIEYKYILFNEDGSITWEAGDNRILNLVKHYRSRSLIKLVDNWRDSTFNPDKRWILQVSEVHLKNIPDEAPFNTSDLVLFINYGKQKHSAVIRKGTQADKWKQLEWFYLITSEQLETNHVIFEGDVSSNFEEQDSFVIPIKYVLQTLENENTKTNVYKQELNLSVNEELISTLEIHFKLYEESDLDKEIEEVYLELEDINEHQTDLKVAKKARDYLKEGVVRRTGLEKYPWAKDDNYPPHVGRLKFSAKWENFQLEFASISKLVKLAIIKSFRGCENDLRERNTFDAYRKPFERLHKYEKFRELFKLPDPEITKDERWKSDVQFGLQRIGGCNPLLLEKVGSSKIRNVLHGVDETKLMVDPANSLRFEADIEHRFYMVDYREILKDLTVAAGDEIKNQPMVRPVCLLRVADDDKLYPVAIQLNWRQDLPNPIFYAVDQKSNPEVWLYVKMWFQMADANVQTLGYHTALTHFIVEAVTVCAYHHLDTKHPIFRILKPHFYGTFILNQKTRTQLFPNYFEPILALGASKEGGLKLINRMYRNWHFHDRAVPNDLARRGVLNSTLKYYPYRDYGLKLWNTIQYAMECIIMKLYKSKHSIREDTALQAFVASLTTEAKLKGVPPCTSIQEVTFILTQIIWVATVQHAIVNFTQFEFLGFVPNMPYLINGVPPTDVTTRMSEEDVLKSLPGFYETLLQMTIANILVTPCAVERSLREYKDEYLEEKFEAILSELRQSLLDYDKQVEQTQDKSISMQALLSANIPMSVAI